MLSFLRGSGKHTKTIWWVLIIVTVVTFLGGFVFLFGAGFDRTQQTRLAGSIGSVNGQQISRATWVQAVEAQRAQYRSQYGSDPADRDLQMVEIQAWRSLVMERLLGEQAKRAGLGVTDREVVLSLQTSPPAMLASAPELQTNGQFDPAKYAALLNDPNINWQPFEEQARMQLPMRKLQERLLASIKLSEPELKAAFRDRFEQASAKVAMLAAMPDTGGPAPTEADLQKVYERYKNRFASPARTQLEVLLLPKQISDEELRIARETAAGYISRARGGEDFAQLVRDYSEGPNAANGGVIERTFTPMDLGALVGLKLAALEPGAIADPIQEGSRYVVFKLLEKTPGSGGSPPTLKLAQLVVRARQSDEVRTKQYEQMVRVRKQAERIGLGPAAAAEGLATSKTEYYDNTTQIPQALAGVPVTADWGLNAKEKAVSPVFEGTDEFALAQVATQRQAGIVPASEVQEQLRELARIEAAVDKLQPQADRFAAAVKGGQTLEQAAAATGATLFELPALTRRQGDPRIAAAPELVGAIFGAPAGQVVGPYRAFNGWYFARKDGSAMPDTAFYEQVKSQLTTEILGQRQQSFFNNYMSSLRASASVVDLRSEY
jgi:parvulin-like peptidyl-prolyl isomerase